MSDEIEAARIAADAAIHAAWVQGVLTLAAGGAAVIGGFLAYRGAVRAAARQVQLEERRYEARVVAYRFRIETILADLEYASAIRLVDTKGGLSPVLSPIHLPEELLENHWEDHALLGEEVVRAIHDLRLQLRSHDLFCNAAMKGHIDMDLLIKTAVAQIGVIRLSVEALGAALAGSVSSKPGGHEPAIVPPIIA